MAGAGSRGPDLTLPRHLVIVGLMGSGKTTVGELVAARLGLPFLDSDRTIESSTGLTAAELTARDGVDALHDLEASVLLRQLGDDAPAVIAAAASTIERANCRKALSSHTVVWLRAAPDVLAQRAAQGSHRPLAADVEAQLRNQSALRDPLFASIATHVFDVAVAEPHVIAAQIATSMRARSAT